MKKTDDSNARRILCNLPYLISTKTLLLVVISALTFAAGVQFFEGCRLFTDDRDGVRNALSQGADFDLKTSVPFSTELEKTIRNLLRYALQYQDVSGFPASAALESQIKQEEKNRDAQIAATLSICSWQVTSGEIDKENLENGFIVKAANGGWRVDKDAITAHFTQVYDDLIEGEKRSMDREYRELMNALEALNGVYYAVVDHTADRITTNTGCTKQSELRRFFSGTKNNLIVFDPNDPVFPADTMDEFVPLVQQAAEGYAQSIDFYLSLNGGLAFNPACEEMQARCDGLYARVHTLLMRFIVFLSLAFLLCVWMCIIAGRREYKGAIKYCATDRLPNEIHLLFHGIIALSMGVLFQNSVQIVLLTKPNDLWFPTFPDYYAWRGEICLVILVLFLLAAACTIKRQYKNKSLLSNTLLALLLRQIGKWKADSDTQQDAQ